MHITSPLIFKLLCILSLLFVTSSAQFFWGLPNRGKGDRLKHAHENNEEDEGNEEDNVPGFGPGRLGFGPGFGFGKPKTGFDDNEENQGTPKKQDQEDKKPIMPDHWKRIFEDGIFKKKPHKEKNKKKEQKKESPKNKFEKPKLPPIQKGGEQGNGQNKQPKLPLPEPVKQGNGQNKQPNLPLPKPVPIPVPVQQGTAETNYQGKWELVSLNSGVSAMHMQLLPTNRLAMFDATSLGKSSIELPPDRCRLIPNTTNQFDCFAHAVEYDLQTNNVRTLKVLTNPWCSSGGLAQDGTLISTGGWEEGEKSIRHYQSCDTCDWKELLDTRLADNRWYATQAMLADGRFVLIGGRRAFNYEFLTPTGNPIPGRIDLPFLLETTDIHENNLYPFVHLAPDGNLFILANFKAILLDVRTNKIVRKYPDLPGGARNYPGSATAAILPINLNNGETNVDIEVLVCGGGQPLAFGKAEKEGIFLPALDTCGKIQVLNPTSNWEMEKMPAARVMSDMLILPNGEILLLNGAKMGASGWQFADDPNLTPYLYTPSKPNGQRFKVLAPTQIPRMYHSSSAVLPEGKILVAGSNTNPGYQFHNVKFPTELRVEKFSPPYLDPALQNLAPKDVKLLNKVFSYGQIIPFSCNIGAPGVILQNDVMVTLYKPPFTTHGYSMDQRLLNLKITFFGPVLGLGNFQLQVQAPARPELAPPGYYLLFVNYRGVPSTGSWVQLH